MGSLLPCFPASDFDETMYICAALNATGLMNAGNDGGVGAYYLTLNQIDGINLFCILHIDGSNTNVDIVWADKAGITTIEGQEYDVTQGWNLTEYSFGSSLSLMDPSVFSPRPEKELSSYFSSRSVITDAITIVDLAVSLLTIVGGEKVWKDIASPDTASAISSYLGDVSLNYLKINYPKKKATVNDNVYLLGLTHDEETDTKESFKVSLDQIRESVGIDYSSLTEQSVPGEYWPGPDGVPQRVYVRTFVGTMPQSITDLEIIIAGGVFSKIAIVTGVLGGMPPNWNVLGHSYYWTVRSMPDSLRIGVSSIAGSLLSGASYSVTIKYTK